MKSSYFRHIVFYGNYFEEFYNEQNPKVQLKIDEVLFLIGNLQMVPSKFLAYMIGSDGLYEIRVELLGNIFRIFCFFDIGNKIVLINGFQKKTQRTPKRFLNKAEKIKREYFNTK